MDAILELPLGLPAHRDAPFSLVPTKVLASWPVGTFAENLVVLDDGSIAVSLLSEARIDRVKLDGAVSVLIQFDLPVTGMSLLKGLIYAAVGVPGVGPIYLWRIDPNSGHGEPCMGIPGVSFINGVTPFSQTELLATESIAGQLVLIDPYKKTASVWLEDERLCPAPGIELLPGANGVKRMRDKVVVSSNGRALLLSIEVLPDGSAGRVITIEQMLRADDFAFDTGGNLYIATHLGNTVDRLRPNGNRVSLAGPLQGAAGSTACAFGRQGTEVSALYVTTTGGVLMPIDGQVQPAKLLRLALEASGWPLEYCES